MSANAASYQVSSVVDSSGAWTTAPTGVASQMVSFSREWNGDPAFLTLYESQGATPDRRFTVTVTVLGRHNSTVNVFTLSDCFAVAWSGPTYTANAMAAGGKADMPSETLSLAFQKIEYK